MRQLTLSSFLSALAVLAICADPGNIRKATGNFATDMVGAPDTRPGTWGNAGVDVTSIPFTPPPGCVVEIVRILGEFVAWQISFNRRPAHRRARCCR